MTTINLTQELKIIKELGFKEKSPLLFYIKEEEAILYFDYRDMKRKSYAFDENGLSMCKVKFKAYRDFHIEMQRLNENE